MAYRFTLASLAAGALIACAVGASDDPPGVLGDGAVGPDGGATGATGSTGPTGSTGATGPGVFDSGPPAVVGGGTDAGDDGPTGSGDDSGTSGSCTGTAQPDGGCSTLADCPYACKTNVSGVACTAGACVITCNGENYDVNGVLSDGCEVAGQCVASQSTPKCPVDDHTQALAANAGSYPCDDGPSAQNMTGTVPSDYRTHLPAIDAFDMTTGAAPDYFSIVGTGGTLCEDDANLTLTMSGTTTQPDCYVLNLLTDNNGGQSCTTSGGSCSISNGSGSYSDGSTLYVWVSKAPSCAAATTPDDGQFTITGHL